MKTAAGTSCGCVREQGFGGLILSAAGVYTCRYRMEIAYSRLSPGCSVWR